MNAVNFSSTVFAAILLAASANAANITYNTNDSATGFGGTSLVLNSTSGVSATLTFAPNANSSSGVPSNINLGNFTLVCPNCSTQQVGTGSTFGAFTFDLVITDITDGGAMGKFVGTSTGGLVYSDVSQVNLLWAPLVLGPGTTNAMTGDFGTTSFTITPNTAIVAPNSGNIPNGVTTVQGFVNSSEVPEPATMSLVGLALLGLGFLRRK